MLGTHVKFCILIFKTFQKVLSINIKLRPEIFLLKLMDKELEKSHGTQFLYKITVAKLSYAKTQKDLIPPTVEE